MNKLFAKFHPISKKKWIEQINTDLKGQNINLGSKIDDDDENKKYRVSSQVKKIISFEQKYKNELTLCYSNRDIYKN